MEASISDSNDPPSYGDAYRAAVHRNLEILMKFNARELTSPINIWGDTIFHVLDLNCHTKAVIELLNSSSSSSMSMIDGLNTKNFNGNIPLHEAARVGALEIAKLMVQKEESLLHERNSMGETPLYWAAASGQKAMLRFLAMKNSSFNPPAGLRRNDGSTILHAAVTGEFYGLALEIMDRYPDLAFAGDKDGITVLHLLVQSPSSFKSGTFYSDINLLYSSFIPLPLLELVIYFCIPSDSHMLTEPENQPSFLQENKKPGIIRQLFRWFSYLRKIDDEKQKHELALKLAKLLIKRESVCMQGGCYINDRSVITKTIINDTLMLAVKHGIIEVVDVILEECPWAIEFVDENGKNILHLAAEFCQLRVFHLLKSKLGFLTMTKIIANVDRKGNTTLHLAAKFDDHRQNKIHISAYKMALETHWFKKMKGLSPTHHLQFRNSDGKTANELFDDTHKQLIKDGVKWIKNTSNAIMLVSTLIATMNFTAAFAVPGGYHQVTGLPIFASKTRDLPTFYAYSSTALFLCVGTLGGSLSVYLSRFHMDEFYFILPLKYIMVGSSLFCSAIYTVAVFVQALILVNNGDFTTIGWCFGISAIIAVVILFILVYVDVMFPFFRYFGYLLFE